MTGLQRSCLPWYKAAMIPLFNFSSPRRLIFGAGSINRLVREAENYGNRLLLVTGRASFLKTEAWKKLDKEFNQGQMRVFTAFIPKEPSPEMVNQISSEARENRVNLVIAVGGGSVLDAGKAISAMIPVKGGVEDYLEGVGSSCHDGRKLPFIAVPTTSGTGSEATKNAVISRTGTSGFKKSLRHENFVPDIALVDPELTLSCPPEVTAACGMDALTQLLESYVSTQSSPMTDALCQSGLKGFGTALETAVKNDPGDIEARSCLSYGAYLSGLALANAGLGTVHGFAGIIGGMAVNAHGQVCGSLLAETTQATIQLLSGSDSSHPALAKYADAAFRLEICHPSVPVPRACDHLIEALFNWTDRFNMPRLSQCGIHQDHLAEIAGTTGQKNNPIQLPRKRLITILENRI